MKIDVKAGDLAAVLKHVSAVVERRTTIPVLANVLLEADKTHLRISGTDLDAVFSAQIDLLTDDAKPKAGTLTVSAHLLAKIAGVLDKEARLTLAHADGLLDVTARGGDDVVHYRIPTLPAADFPCFVEPEWTDAFEIAPRLFAAALERVRFAISTEETRYYLNGVFLHVPPSGPLTLAATDGHRLAVTELDPPEGVEGMPDIILPRKMVALLADLCGSAAQGEAAPPLTVQVHPRRICFDLGGFRLDSKTIDGTFPDYTRVIPTANPGRLTVRPQALADAVKRLTLISSEKTRAVRVTLAPDSMALRVVSPENGTAEERLGCAYEGEPVTIGFNAAYLADVLAQLGGAAECHVETADPAAPTLFRSGPDAPTRYVLMPMRV